MSNAVKVAIGFVREPPRYYYTTFGAARKIVRLARGPRWFSIREQNETLLINPRYVEVIQTTDNVQPKGAHPLVTESDVHPEGAEP
jgi:hypothetical protein